MVLARPFTGLRPRTWEDVAHLQPRSAGFDEALEGAVDDLARRVAEGALVRDTTPTATAFWVDDQHDGSSHRTAGAIVALRVDRPGPDAVLPHEATFPEPVARRVRTRNRLGAETTPTLVVLREPVDAFGAWLAEATAPGAASPADGAPNVLVHDDEHGARHHARPHALPDDVLAALRGVPALVADGHHRIAAALAPEAVARGSILAWLVAADHAPRLHPVHRTVGRLPQDPMGRLREAGVAVTDADPRPDPEAPVLVTEDGAVRLAVRPGTRAAEELAALHPTVRDLPAALVHVVLQRVLGIGTRRDEMGTTIDAAGAVRDVADGRCAAAVLACGPSIEDVWRAAEAGVLLPPKATWFAPKPYAGAVLRPLDEEHAG